MRQRPFSYNSYYMQPLLQRWLHKCHRLTSLNPRPRLCKDVQELMQPTVVPTKYVCEELTGEFAEYWKTIQKDDGNGLEVIQLNALARWHAFPFKIGKRTEEYALPHDFFAEIFHDYFFLGSLRQYIKVELVDEMPANSDWKGISKRKGQHVFSGPPEVQIEIKRPPNQLWTKELIQEHLDTLLHEMAHAFLMIYSSTAAFAGSWHYPEIEKLKD